MEKIKETELAKHVIKYLTDLKWEVYQEVQVHSFGKIADIVAVQNGVVWIIECKTSLSMSVMEQAHTWRGYANFISVAVPSARRGKCREFAYKVLKTFGIGCLEVSSYLHRPIHNTIPPKLKRNGLKKYILNSLTEKHKTWAEAGNDAGKRYTPFQDTVSQIYRLLKSKPGLPIKEVIESVQHHYSSDQCARTSISAWIRKGIIKNIKMDRTGRTYKLYYEEET